MKQIDTKTGPGVIGAKHAWCIMITVTESDVLNVESATIEPALNVAIRTEAWRDGERLNGQPDANGYLRQSLSPIGLGVR